MQAKVEWYFIDNPRMNLGVPSHGFHHVYANECTSHAERVSCTLLGRGLDFKQQSENNENFKKSYKTAQSFEDSSVFLCSPFLSLTSQQPKFTRIKNQLSRRNSLPES